MADLPAHVAFFGDQERRFIMPPELVAELERKTGIGIGGLCKRLFASDFRLAEITETIRLGLIGGGTDPEEAAALVTAYIAPRPLMEGYALALAILETLYFGKAATDE